MGIIHACTIPLGTYLQCLYRWEARLGARQGKEPRKLSTAPAVAAGDQRSATWEPVSVYRKEECQLPLLPFGGSFLRFCLNRVMWCWAPRNSAPLCAGWVSPRIEIEGWGSLEGNFLQTLPYQPWYCCLQALKMMARDLHA